MIKEKALDIKISSANLKYYNSLGFKCKPHDIINIPINKVNPNSHIKITSICEICGKENTISLKNYYHCKNKGGIYACHKCSSIKNKKTCLIKYGVDNYNKSLEGKEKRKETILKKYGVDHYSKTEEFKNKCKETFTKKYGKHYLKTEEFKNKCKETCLKKYGVNFPMKSKIIQEKSKKTLFEKYGVNNISQVDDIKRLKEEACLKKYGSKNFFQTDEFFRLRKEYCLKKYGENHEMQNEEYFRNHLIKSFNIKKYRETDLYYQGSYELDFLEKYYSLFEIKNGLSFYYNIEQDKHRYFSDFYIPSFNLIIEIKSSYTLGLNKYITLLKEKTVIDKGYNFMIILNKDYTNFNNLIRLKSQRNEEHT
jgi:hypothetical protein